MIVTRGMGEDSRLITKGYGIFWATWREIVKFTLSIVRSVGFPLER